MEIEAVVLPPGLVNDSKMTDPSDQFLQDEHCNIAANLIGKPFLDDHQPDKPLGTITGARMDPVTKQLYITAHIPEDTEAQRSAHQRILRYYNCCIWYILLIYIYIYSFIL